MLESSVLYPDPSVVEDYNHRKLGALYMPFSDAPRGMKKLTEDQYIDAGKSLRDEIRREVKRYRPKLLILSSEWFARVSNARNARYFFDFVESLEPESIEILLYARRPSEYFLSASQQRLRASSQFKPIFEVNTNSILDGFERLCPNYSITVRTFDRKLMTGGNIVADFAEAYIPECRSTLESSNVKSKPNLSFSAETMVILQEFRRVHFGDQEDVFNKETRRFMRELRQIDSADGNPRPLLKDAWKNYLDYGDDRALRLQVRRGVTFTNFDYNRLEKGDFAPQPDGNSRVADVVMVDSDRLSRVVDDLSRSSWFSTRTETEWLLALSNM